VGHAAEFSPYSHSFYSILPFLVFFVSFFGFAYFLGSATNLDTFERSFVEKWYESHRPHLIEGKHNGVEALALRDDYEVQVQLCPGSYAEYGLVYDVMTFSDDPKLKGKVTGTLADKQALMRECIVHKKRLFVPGTSQRPISLAVQQRMFQIISLAKAKRMIRDSSKKKHSWFAAL